MVHVDDVLGIERDVRREEFKLRGEYWFGNIDAEDFPAIWGCYRSRADGDWSAATTKRTRLSQLRLSAVAVDSLLAFEGPADVDALADYHEDRIRQEKRSDSSNGDAATKVDGPSPGTINGYIQAVKALFEWAHTQPTYGDFSWFRFIEQRERKQTPKDPDEMLGEADIAALRERAKYARTRALVEFMADTGLRRTATLQLRVGDLDLDTNTFSVNPDGAAQKGVEDYEIGRWPLKDSPFFLRQWLHQDHPEKPAPPDDAPLFPVIEGYDADDRADCAAGPRAVAFQIDNAAESAGITKPTNLHSFRHACVKRLRWKYEFEWEEIRDRLAWSERSLSEMMALYGRLDEQERIDRMRAAYGQTADGTAVDDGPAERQCPNCGMAVEASWSICPTCKVGLDEWEPAGLSPDVYRALADLSGDGARRLVELVEGAEADPEDRALLHGDG